MLPKIHIEIERWRFNKNYNIYVSNMGNFKDKSKETITPKVEKGGYLQIPICNNKRGIVKYLQAHRVVMETWCPKVNMWKEKLTVDHLDHNKRNNKTSNLEWVTQKENMRRAAADIIYDSKDAEIQSLRDKIKILEDKLENKIDAEFADITAVGIKDFHSYSAVKSYLCTINPAYKNTKMDTLKKQIQKSHNSGTTYMGFNWIIKR